MNNLKKSIMGKYNAEDVDKLLSKVRNDYEKCLKEQKERIIQLRDENKEMMDIIEKYKNNEMYIISAITKAEETAESIINDAERRAIERLKRVESEEEQVRQAVQGCYDRLNNLKTASESICRAVSKTMGEHDQTQDIKRRSNLRSVKSFYDITS